MSATVLFGGLWPAAAASTEDRIAAFRAPADTCGAQPPYASADPGQYRTFSEEQRKAAAGDAREVAVWVKCRVGWVARYQQTVDDLKAATGGETALQRSPLGTTILTDLAAAKETLQAQRAVLEAQFLAIGGVKPASVGDTTAAAPEGEHHHMHDGMNGEMAMPPQH